MAKIRHEINILTKEDSADADRPELVQLDTTQYNGTVTYYFEAVYLNSSSADEVRLVRSDTTVDATLTGDTSGTQRRKRTSFTPPSGQTTYYVRPAVTSGITLRSARIIVIQEATTITNSEVQIEIGNYETGKTNTTDSALTNPKYWYYDSANWDGTVTFYAEVTSVIASNMYTHTIKLQEDNGSFGSWTDKVTIVSASTSTTVTRTRSASFTPTSGRNYRIVGVVSNSMTNYSIYNAKIVVQQEGLDQSVTTGGSINSIQGGTADTNQPIQALGQSFTAGSSYSLNTVALELFKTGTPTDNLVLEILTTSITGTVVGTADNFDSATVAGSGTPLTFYKFTFSTPVSISSGTKYYLRVTRSGARDVNNFVSWRYANNSVYANGGAYIRNNNIWTSESSTDDFKFKVYTSFTKLEEQYLLANTGSFGGSTGLKDYDTYYDPAEWS